MQHQNYEKPSILPISATSIAAQRDRFEERFVLPDRTKSFASIHPKIVEILRAGKHAVLLQLDGLGLDAAHEAIQRGDRFLGMLRNYGSLDAWTAQWPATTTAQMTTLYSGLPVEQHGLIEWVVYDPKTELLISPLPFSGAREGTRNTLLERGVAPEDIFPHGRFAAQLVREGFRLILIGKEDYLSSPMSTVVCPEAEILPAESTEQAALNLVAALTHADRPTCVILYTDLIDKSNHQFTKHAPQTTEVISELSETLLKNVVEGLPSLERDFVLMVTSDHGHMSVNENPPLYINKLLPDVDSFLQKRSDGSVIPCSGGFRSLFLHAIPERREELIVKLQHLLEGKADVFRLETLVQIGVFDAELCSNSFYARAGNVCILPYEGQSAYYYIPGLFELKNASVHGGASAEEMRTPFFELTKEQLGRYLQAKQE